MLQHDAVAKFVATGFRNSGFCLRFVAPFSRDLRGLNGTQAQALGV